MLENSFKIVSIPGNLIRLANQGPVTRIDSNYQQPWSEILNVYNFTLGSYTVDSTGLSPGNYSATLSNLTVGGLYGQYFSGDWRSAISAGNIGTLPLSSPTKFTSIAYGSRGDSYGFIAIGYFIPPTTGTYTFYTSSDDGSGVWVGDIASASSGRTTTNAVVNNGMGSGQGDTKRSGTISLTANTVYAIRVVHEEGTGGDNLTFSWAGPGIAETTNLAQYFYYYGTGANFAPPLIIGYQERSNTSITNMPVSASLPVFTTRIPFTVSGTGVSYQPVAAYTGGESAPVSTIKQYWY